MRLIEFFCDEDSSLFFIDETDIPWAKVLLEEGYKNVIVNDIRPAPNVSFLYLLPRLYGHKEDMRAAARREKFNKHIAQEWIKHKYGSKELQEFEEYCEVLCKK